MPKESKLSQKTILISVGIIAIALIASAYLLSGGLKTQPSTSGEFKLPDSFISMQGNIIAVKSGGCNQGYLSNEDLIKSGDCKNLNNLAPCIRIPLSLISYYDRGNGNYEYFTSKLTCDGENKPYCQIKMDGEIIKQGCFNLGLEAITLYADKSTDIGKNHSFEICCSAKEQNAPFDVCKSFTMDKICTPIQVSLSSVTCNIVKVQPPYVVDDININYLIENKGENVNIYPFVELYAGWSDSQCTGNKNTLTFYKNWFNNMEPVSYLLTTNAIANKQFSDIAFGTNAVGQGGQTDIGINPKCFYFKLYLGSEPASGYPPETISPKSVIATYESAYNPC